MLIFETFFRFFDTTIVETIADFEIPRCLKYNTREGKSEKKTVEAQKKFLKEISVKKQYKILLGLSLHTMQDYFAHCVLAKAISAKNNYYNKKGAKNINYSLNKYFLFFKLNEKIYDGNVQYGRDHFEDDIGVFSWRIYFARMATVEAFYNWSTNSRIYDLRAGQNSNNNFIYYHKFKYIGYYWTVIARRYYLTINGKWYW